MSTRRIYSAPDLARAEQAVAAAREVGLDDDCLSLVARSDIEVGAVPDDRTILIEQSRDDLGDWRGVGG